MKMSSSTDYLGLNKLKFFNDLRDTLPKTITKTQNLLTLRDGVLYSWDFQNSCVITLNLKEFRTRTNADIASQILLPTNPPYFNVELLRVNSLNTLLVVAGPNGVLVLELPERCPPHGAFLNNKEMIYCRSHSLDEHLLVHNQTIEVRQVKFHPACPSNTHILVLTSDNALRLYNISNSTALSLAVYSVGPRPTGVMPGTKSFFLGLLGETAIDFDFSVPELCKHDNLSREHMDSKNLQWPIFLLDGDGMVFFITINLNDQFMPKVKGPLPVWPKYKTDCLNVACSILCQPCVPPIICIATTNGTLHHYIVLPTDGEEDHTQNNKNITGYSETADRALYIFEKIELELGLITTNAFTEFSCPIFLHADESCPSHYFASHGAGVHSVFVPAVDSLQKYVDVFEDSDTLQQIVNQPSTADYLICTKTASSDSINPVIGFTVYYDPSSIVALLAKGAVVSTLVETYASLPFIEDVVLEDIKELNLPLKKMLSGPFDLHIQKILRQCSTQPILKLSETSERSKQECYELLQRAAQVFREEYFRQHEKAREEIEKRIKVLQVLKSYQSNELKKLNIEKQTLQQQAENLAEKYEDIKDKQNDFKKRCEMLLMLVAQKRSEPSEADKHYTSELNEIQIKIKTFIKCINKLKTQMKYQEIQMENWNREQVKKDVGLGSLQSETLKTNLEDTTNQIMEMLNSVSEYKKQLGLN